MVRAIGAGCAKVVGDGHEAAGDRKGQPADERAMDQHNNSVGRSMGSQKGACADLCKQALNDGQLEVLNP